MNARHVLLTLGMGTLAQAAQAQAPVPQPTPRQLPPAVTIDTTNAVTVQNRRGVPVTVYLEQGWFDRRLGVVPANATRSLPLSGVTSRGRATVRLSVHPEGQAADLATQTIRLEAPARVALVVPPEGGASTGMTEVLAGDAAAEATLTVDNPSARRVTVFAQQGRFDVRLGEVAANGRTTLRFPKSVSMRGEPLTFVLRPEGALDRASQAVRVQRGDHLGIQLPTF